MYSYFKGKITFKTPTSIILEVANIGYEMKIPLSYGDKISEGQTKTFYLYYQVLEKAHNLYAFFTSVERDFFKLLISVNGVGPSKGLCFFSSMSLGEMQTAIANEDIKKIESVKGIGNRIAKLVILQLKDKILFHTPESPQEQEKQQIVLQAIEALVQLGLSPKVAEKKVKETIKTDLNMTLETLIKLGLKN